MLINNTTELGKYMDATGTITFDKIKGTIEFVESTVLLPIIGEKLFTEIQDAVKENTNDDDLLSLIDKCRKVIGPFTAYYFIPKAEVALTDGGATRTESNNTKTAFAYQVTNARAQRLLEGESNIELLLKYLNDHSTNFSNWSDSDEYKEYQSLFIKTGTDFSSLYKTHQPFRNFSAIRFKMVDVEMLTIRPYITTSLFDSLKEKDQQKDSEWSAEEKLLLFYIKKSIAYYSIAAAIPHLSIRIDQNGLSVVSDNSVTINKDSEIRKDADPNKISMLINSCNASGSQYLQEAIKYITNNSEKFPDWEAPVKQTESSNNNHTRKGSFLM